MHIISTRIKRQIAVNTRNLIYDQFSCDLLKPFYLVVVFTNKNRDISSIVSLTKAESDV